MRAPGLNLTGGAHWPVGDRGGERDGRLTGRARLSSLTLVQMAGELTGGDAGHERAS